MGEIIENALSEIDIPCYYLKRPKGEYSCIIYSYKEYTGAKSDNQEENTKYDIYLNFITKDNINRDIDKIKNALKKAKFNKVVINPPLPMEGDNSDFYQITMNYTKRKTMV